MLLNHPYEVDVVLAKVRTLDTSFNIVHRQLDLPIPILGPFHQDTELKVPDDHLHIDYRFMHKKYYDFQSKFFSPSLLPRIVMGINEFVSYSFDRIKLPFLRKAPLFPVGGDYRQFLDILQDKYQDKKVVCNRCPHRGVDLSSCPKDGQTVVCVGHGLRWDIKSGNMVRY